MILIVIACITLNIFTSSTNADGNLRLAFVPFANLTNQFLFTIQPNDGLNLSMSLLPQIFGKAPLPSDPMYYVNYFWQTYVGYCILIILGVAFIVIFTLVGFCYCCCRCCCHRCGAKPPEPSHTNTKRKRIVLNVLLVLFSSMILIGAVVAMASNVILLDAIKLPNNSVDPNGNVFSNINSVLQGVISYINYIVNNAQTTGYAILQNTMAKMLTILSNCVSLLINTFLNQLNYNLILNATDLFVNAFNNEATIATLLSNISSTHQTASNSYIDYLKIFVQNMTNILNQSPCQNYTIQCKDINDTLAMVKIGFNISNINYGFDKNASNIMSAFNISKMVAAKLTFVSNAQNVTSQINSTLNGYVNDFSKYLNANSSFLSTFNATLAIKDSLIASLIAYRDSTYSSKLNGFQSINDNVVFNYYSSVFYGFIAVIGIILLIVLLFYVGLCFGICGGPNFEDSPCCSKGAGSGFLMGSVAISFLFGWIIMIITMMMFLGGGLVQTEACSYFSGNYPSKPLATIDKLINTSLTTLNITFPINGVFLGLPNINYVQSLLNTCPTSTDLLSAFQLPSYYISQVADVFYQQFIQAAIVTLVQNIRNYKIPTIDTTALSNSSTEVLGIIGSLNDPSSAQTITELQKTVTMLGDIGGFLNTVDTLVQVSNGSFPEFSKSLSSAMIQFNQSTFYMTSLKNTYIDQKIKFNNGFVPLKPLINNLINYIDSLPSRVSDAVSTAVATTNATIGQNVSSLVNQTLFDVLRSLGNCQSLSVVVKASINILCTTLLVPFNNLWMGIGWFLLFIIPAIITALKLTRLYKISHIETNTSQHGKAYQRTNLFLSEMDMQKIRTGTPNQK